MTITLTLDDSEESIRAEIHDGDLYLSIIAREGRIQRVPGMEAAIGRIFPDWPLARRVSLAGKLLVTLASELAKGRKEAA